MRRFDQISQCFASSPGRIPPPSQRRGSHRGHLELQCSGQLLRSTFPCQGHVDLASGHPVCPASYTVYRKVPNATSWGAGTTLSGGTTSYTDTSVIAGSAYEYRIVKSAGTYTGYGYIQAGVAAPLVENRGKLVLIVDNTIASASRPSSRVCSRTSPAMAGLWCAVTLVAAILSPALRPSSSRSTIPTR